MSDNPPSPEEIQVLRTIADRSRYVRQLAQECRLFSDPFTKEAQSKQDDLWSAEALLDMSLKQLETL